MRPHSPTPWSVEYPDADEIVIVSRSGTDDAEDIASMIVRHDIHPNMETNAHVMAAAPQLLAAAQKALPLLIRLGDFIANKEDRCEVILEMRAAIEAAEVKS